MALRYITDNGRTIKSTSGGGTDNGIPKSTTSSFTITNNAPSYDTVTGALIVAGGIGENQIRGFAEQKDWYIYTNIGIGYILDWVKCPKFK